MRFDFVTLFPECFESLRVSRIWQRAEEKGLLEFDTHQLRDFATDKHHTVDDIPYGGGAGMVLKIEPLVKALESLPQMPKRRVLCASPQGRKVDQGWVEELAEFDQLVLISGRYEGFDERFIEGWVDESFSIGDYVLSGGELPSMVLAEAVARVIPGVLGDECSAKEDSFSSGRLKYPQFTRPADFRGKVVPQVLRSGNHAEIEEWRKEVSWKRTQERRPELLEKAKR